MKRHTSFLKQRRVRRSIQAAIAGAAVLGTGLIMTPAQAVNYTVNTANGVPGTVTLRGAIEDAVSSSNFDHSNYIDLDPSLAGEVITTSGLPSLTNGTTVTLNDITVNGSPLTAFARDNNHGGSYVITDSTINNGVTAEGYDSVNDDRAYVSIEGSFINGSINAADGGKIDIDDSSTWHIISSGTDSEGTQSLITVTDSFVDGNVQATSGGKIDISGNTTVDGNVTATGTKTLNGSIIRSNVAITDTFVIGNVSASSGGILNATDSRIVNNASASGTNSSLTINNSLVGSVDASYKLLSNTGALSVTANATANITNGSKILGGATVGGLGSSLTINNSTVGNNQGGTWESGTGNVKATGGSTLSTQNNAIILGNVDVDNARVNIQNSTIGAQALGSGNITLHESTGTFSNSTIYGNISADDSAITLASTNIGSLDGSGNTQSGTGNFTLSGDGQASIYQNVNIYGNVTIKDDAILDIYDVSNNIKFNNGAGTTSFEGNSLFRANMRVTSPLQVDHLQVTDSASLLPNYDGSHGYGGIDIGIVNAISILDYQSRNGEFLLVETPLDTKVNYTSTSGPGSVEVYLDSNEVNFNKFAGTENEKSVGDFLSRYIASYQDDPTELNFSKLPDFDPGNLANGLLGNVYQSMVDVTYDEDLSSFGWLAAGLEPFSLHNSQAYWNQKALVDNILNNVNNVGDTTGANPSNFAMNFADMSGAPVQLAALHRATSTPATGALYANGNGSSSNSGIWATYTNARQRTDGDSGIGSSDWKSTTNGVTVGYTNAGDSFDWGLAVGYQKSKLRFSDIWASGEQSGWNTGLYGTLKRSSLYLTGILGYGNYNNDTDSFLVSDTTKYKNKATSVALEVGRRLQENSSGGLSPYGSLLWVNNKQSGAEIGGSGSGVLLRSNSNNTFTTELGLRYQHRLFDDAGSLKGGWQGGLAWLHQGSDTGMDSKFGFSDINGDIAGGGSLKIKGTPLAGNSLVARLGVYGRLANQVVGFAGYQGTFGSDQKINAVSAGIGYQF